MSEAVSLPPILLLLGGDLLTLLLYATILFFILYSFFISYHWIRFGENAFMATLSLAVYFGGSALFLFTLFAAYQLL